MCPHFQPDETLLALTLLLDRLWLPQRLFGQVVYTPYQATQTRFTVEPSVRYVYTIYKIEQVVISIFHILIYGGFHKWSHPQMDGLQHLKLRDIMENHGKSVFLNG